MEEDKKPPKPPIVSRRSFLEGLGLAVAGTAAPGAQQQAFAGTPHQPEPPGPHRETPYKRKVFDQQQWQTACVLCDLILPADERSGSATQAGVPEFIDDWIHFRRQQDGNDSLLAEIFGGFLWLDSESQRLFATRFVDAEPSRQRQILDRIAWPEHAAPADRRWAHFFTEFRNLTVSGFYSSKMGIADLPYLGNTVVEKWTGCSDEIWRMIEERRSSGYQGIRLPPPSKP